MAVKDGEDGDRFEVWDVNFRSLLAFLALDTQWRVVPTPGGGLFRLGIDYASGRPLYGRRNRRRERRLLADIRIMEAAALDVFTGVDA